MSWRKTVSACGKIPFYKRKLAVKLLTKLVIGQKKGKAEKKAGREHVYWCAECAAWHIGNKRQGKVKYAMEEEE